MGFTDNTIASRKANDGGKPVSGRALIFDFDGVLADTETLYWQAWAEVLKRYGIDLSWSEYGRIGRGRSDQHMLSKLFDARLEPTMLTALEAEAKTVRKIVLSRCKRRSPIPASSVTMLHLLQRYPLGLVTTSRRAEVEPLLQAAGIVSCFSAIVMRDDYRNPKPDPEPYLLIQERLGISGGMAFEDSEAGQMSAASAGLTVIAVDDPGRLPEIAAASLKLFLA
jgi:putative hydrolase of the HAD superfamily